MVQYYVGKCRFSVYRCPQFLIVATYLTVWKMSFSFSLFALVDCMSTFWCSWKGSISSVCKVEHVCLQRSITKDIVCREVTVARSLMIPITISASTAENGDLWLFSATVCSF